MPAIITRGAMSATGFGFGRISIGTNSWLSRLPAGSNNAYAIHANSLGKPTITWVESSVSADPFLLLNSDGSQNVGAYVTSSVSGYSHVTIDSSDNIYYTGNFDSRTSVFVAKTTSSGSSAWQYSIDYPFSSSPYNSISYTTVTVDSSGNVYSVARFVDGSNIIYGLVITKLNSSGAIQWSSDYRFTNGDAIFTCSYPHIDTSGNLVVSGTKDGTNGNFVALINTSTGAVNSSYAISNIFDGYPSSVVSDSSANYYLTGGYGPGPNYPIIAKFDSSFSLQWAKYLSSSNYRNWYGGIAIDSFGSNLYLGSIYDASGGSAAGAAAVAQVSTSGTLNWVRTIKNTTASYGTRPATARSIYAANNYWYFSGYARDPFTAGSTIVFAFQGVQSGGTTKTVGSWQLGTTTLSAVSFTPSATLQGMTVTTTGAGRTSQAVTTYTPTTTVSVFS